LETGRKTVQFSGGRYDDLINVIEYWYCQDVTEQNAEKKLEILAQKLTSQIIN